MSRAALSLRRTPREWAGHAARLMSRVLIVEDQPAVANALAVLFSVHEIPYLVARSPAEALPLMAGGSVGVVVQDMNFTPSAIVKASPMPPEAEHRR